MQAGVCKADTGRGFERYRLFTSVTKSGVGFYHRIETDRARWNLEGGERLSFDSRLITPIDATNHICSHERKEIV